VEAAGLVEVYADEDAKQAMRLTPEGERVAQLELHDEWQVASRRYLSEGSMALLDRLADDDATKEVGGARALLLAS
jgi:hypothetical protein